VTNVTDVPDTVQTEVVDELKVTGLPEAPPVALRLSGAWSNVLAVIAAKVIVWVAEPTVRLP